MEKDAAAIDTVEFTDNFICRSSITRSDMLFITFGSSIFAKELPSCVSTGDQALFTQRGSSIILCFALRLLVVFIENIRNPIEARNGGLPHSSLPKRRIFEYKDTNFWSKYTLLLNQRISASVQGTPRRGNEHIAQGIALGMMKRCSAP